MKYLRKIFFAVLTIITHANAMEEQEYFPSAFRTAEGLTCSVYLARIPCINLQTELGEKFSVPKDIALQSPLWAQRNAQQQPIILPTRIIGIVTQLLAAAHIQKELPLPKLLDVTYEAQMKGEIEKAFCTSRAVRIPLYYASLPLPLYTYEDTLYQKILIETLEGCSSHPLLLEIIAYTLSRQSWKTPYDPAKAYRHLLSKNVCPAALAIARYSYLLRNVCLKETLGRISTEEPSGWSYYRDAFSPTTLEVPAASCTFTPEEYLHFKEPTLKERVKGECYKLDHLMLGSAAGLDGLENIRSVQQLDLSYNYLTALSPFFMLLLQLKDLNLSHNRLAILPSLRSLTHLQSLDVSHNQLTSLEEAELDQLRNLQHIDTRNNLVPLAVHITSTN